MQRIAEELAALRGSVDALAQRFDALIAVNAALRARLEQSETARGDLAAQTEHIIELLAESRREVRTLRGQSALPPG